MAGTHDAHDDAAAAAIRVRIKAHFARQSHAASAGVSVHVFRLNVARARARVRCPASAIIKLIYSLWICQCAAECVRALCDIICDMLGGRTAVLARVVFGKPIVSN